MLNALPTHPSLLHPLTGLPLQAIGLRRNGDPLWPIMGGDGTGGDANDGAGAADTSGSANDGGDGAGDDDGAANLGDAGKQALDRMKAERNAAREAAKKAADELAALKAAAEGREAEHKAQLDAQRVRDEALAAANVRILKAEIRAAAAGKVNPDLISDLPVLMDLSALEVGADGEVDRTAVEAAITDLISKKPSLAAQGSKFQGAADGGTRKESQPSMDDQIAEARKAGNHALAIALKRQKAYAEKP